MKVFPNVTNTHLYINKKETKQKIFQKSTHHMTPHVIQHAH
jgi:hypothetical protein